MNAFKPEKELNKKVYDINEINFHLDYIETKTVLGIDIYKYSDYPSGSQEYIPVLFNSLYESTVSSCLKHEKFFFQKYGDTIPFFESQFISTGDGGFQMFDNPIQSILFAAYFQLNVRRFNSDTFGTNLRKNLCNIIGRIELRYAITTDNIFNYNGNFYGPAIINNSRLLSKDHLNRLLADFQTIDWFDKNLNTIENLLTITKEDFLKIKYFEDYTDSENSLLFGKRKIQPVKAVDILKIGTIKAKNTILEIFNLRIQIGLVALAKDGYNSFLVTIGNLNTQGIE